MDTGDRLDIIEAYARYAHTYDEGRLDEMAMMFTEDCTFEIRGSISTMPSTMTGRGEILAQMTERRRATVDAQRRHIITGTIVQSLGPDHAAAQAYLLLASTTQGALVLPTTGRYDDELRRVEGRWLFSRKVLTLDSALT